MVPCVFRDLFKFYTLEARGEAVTARRISVHPPGAILGHTGMSSFPPSCQVCREQNQINVWLWFQKPTSTELVARSTRQLCPWGSGLTGNTHRQKCPESGHCWCLTAAKRTRHTGTPGTEQPGVFSAFLPPLTRALPHPPAALPYLSGWPKACTQLC